MAGEVSQQQIRAEAGAFMYQERDEKHSRGYRLEAGTGEYEERISKHYGPQSGRGVCVSEGRGAMRLRGSISD